MWSKSQIAALEALKIPRYEWLGKSPESGNLRTEAHKTEASEESDHSQSIANTESAAVSTINAEAQPAPALYQLGPWLLGFPSALPVEVFPWLMDLSKYIESRPTLVSDAGDKTVIDCSPYAKMLLTPEEKKTLWALLKPALRS